MIMRAFDFETIEEDIVHEATLLDDSLLNAVYCEMISFTACDDVADGLDKVAELFFFIYTAH
jgi:hypothetical protein